MDGVTMDVGGVAGLRNVKNAISVARRVLENTEHSLIVGNQATEFAVRMGFPLETLSTLTSYGVWKQWQYNNCQPNFWKNVLPDSKTSCGPYQAVPNIPNGQTAQNPEVGEDNHDTIGIVAIDSQGHLAAGTSTNGLRHKIPGRVGDSPIAGSGAYADQEVGAAVATGNGDIMMRFSSSFLAVELMRQGESPAKAAEAVVRRIAKYYPKFDGAVIALNKDGVYGAACNGLSAFPYYASSLELGGPTFLEILCKLV